MAGKREPAHRDDRGEHGGVDERREVGSQDPGRRHEHRADERRRHPLRAWRPIRPPERLATQQLLNDLRMSFNARHRSRQRGGDDVREQRRGRAEEHDLAAEVAEIRSRLESLPGRDRPTRVGTGEIDPDVSCRVRWDRHVSVADRHHPVRLSKGRFAAGVQRLDDVGRGALRDAQRFHGETGLQGAVHIEDQRHPPHDPVVVRPPVEETDARRMLGELGHRRQKSRPGRHELCRVVAGGDESRLGRSARPIRRVGDEAAQDNRRVVHRPRKGAVRSSCPLVRRRRRGPFPRTGNRRRSTRPRRASTRR